MKNPILLGSRKYLEAVLHGDLRGDEVPPELTSREKVHKIIQNVKKENKDPNNENKLRSSSLKLLEQSLGSLEGKIHFGKTGSLQKRIGKDTTKDG